MSAGPPTVVVLEADERLRWVLRVALEEAGHSVWAGEAAPDAATALVAPADAAAPLLVVGASEGVRAAARLWRDELAGRGAAIPSALLLAAPGDPLEDLLRPGDGVLQQPFAVAALCEHVATLLRDAPTLDGGGNATDGLAFDPGALTVAVDGERVELTRAEFRVLTALAARPGELVESAVLIEAGWPDGSVVYEETLAKHVARLRRKLDEVDAPVALLSVAGFGYELV